MNKDLVGETEKRDCILEVYRGRNKNTQEKRVLEKAIVIVKENKSEKQKLVFQLISSGLWH